jgi:predicted RNA-binding Zn-ribbon protein involved in translation (DUF1610 family)
MPAPICVPCRREMRCKQNEVMVNDPPSPGFPATYWYGDVFKCPRCGHEIVTGFGVGMAHEDLTPNECGRSLLFEYPK